MLGGGSGVVLPLAEVLDLTSLFIQPHGAVEMRVVAALNREEPDFSAEELGGDSAWHGW